MIVPEGAPRRVPGRRDRRHVPAQLRVPRARRAGARLRRRDLAGGAQAPGEGRLSRRREDRQDRRRGRVRQLPARRRRRRAAPRRLARPAAGRVRAAPAGAAGEHRPPDDRRRPPARRRAGAPRRDRARARGRTSCNANGGAIVALDPRDGSVLAMASNPTYKPSRLRRPRRSEEARAAHGREVAKQRNYPGHQPRDRRRLSAGLDVQAADGARGDLGRPALAVRVHPVHAVRRRTGSTQFQLQELEPVHERADVADDGARAVLRHVLLRRRQPLLHARRARAQYWTAMQTWARKFGFGQAPGSTSAARRPGSCRRRRGASASVARAWDRAWNPGDLIQLAIGQKDINVTPLQMARFYAAIANGGKLVTPHLVSSIEQPGNDGSPPVPLYTFPPSRRSRSRSTRGALASSARASTRRRTTPTAPRPASSAASPSRSPARPGTAEKVVQLPGYPFGHLEDQAWWCGWGPFDGNEYVTQPAQAGADRRLRRDRERRPRRRRRGAGGAEGLRALVPGEGRRPGGASRLIRLRLHAAHARTVPRPRRRRRLRAPARLAPARRGRRARRLRALGRRRDHAPRRRGRRELLRRAPGDRRRRSASPASSSRSRSTPTATAARRGASTP